MTGDHCRWNFHCRCAFLNPSIAIRLTRPIVAIPRTNAIGIAIGLVLLCPTGHLASRTFPNTVVDVFASLDLHCNTPCISNFINTAMQVDAGVLSPSIAVHLTLPIVAIPRTKAMTIDIGSGIECPALHLRAIHPTIPGARFLYGGASTFSPCTR